MLTNSVLLRVPALQMPIAEIYATHLSFGYGNGDNVAKNFPEPACWVKDRYVWLCPLQPDAELDCVHSLYGEVMKGQTFAINLLDVHGLYCLGAYLKQTACAELLPFTGLVHAFAGSKMATRIGMNHEHGSPWESYDLLTPVLFLENGRPRSIYTMWHTDKPEAASLIAFCADDVSLFVEQMAQPAVAA
jgi:hypothetical protein